MRLAAGEEGVAYTLMDTDVLLHWPAVTGITRAPGAYYIRSKARIVRLPLRELDQHQRAAFEALASRHGVTIS
jgi:hypothetical protein